MLINPLHAAEPVPPMEPSPYLPTTRRFANPIYLRPERIPEYGSLETEQRGQVDTARASLDDPALRQTRSTATLPGPPSATRWRSSSRPRGRPAGRRPFAAYRRREGDGLVGLRDLVGAGQLHGPRYSDWPAGAPPPRERPTWRSSANSTPPRSSSTCWLQWVLDEQLAAVQTGSRRAGMTLGIMHDLAVGVSRTGADAWALQDIYAHGMTVGAPPDPYNQNGQNWNQPPWRPDRLAESAYEPFRQMVSTILRHAGGIRVDHVIGMFRLWWIPDGASPTEGTYVRYDHDALIGILALEAHRAGAVVVGGGSRHRGAVGSGVPTRSGHPRDVDPVVRVRLRQRRQPVGSGAVAGVLPGLGHHARPAADRRLPGGGARTAAQRSSGVLTRSLTDELAADEAEPTAWLDNLRRRQAC